MHEALGAGKHRVDACDQSRVAEALDKFEHAGCTDAACAELCGEIAFALSRRAHVGEDGGEKLRVHLAGAHQLDGRNANAFLRDLAARAHRSGIHAADIGVVGAVGDIEGCALTAGEEYGRDHGDVGQMCAAAIGIIEQSHIAGPEAQIGENSCNGHGHGAEMHGHVVAHGDEIAVRGEDSGGVIAALFDIGREGGAAQGRAHFHRDRVKCVADDGDFGGIELATRGHRRAPAFGARMRLLNASTEAVQPVGRYVVAESSVMRRGR